MENDHGGESFTIKSQLIEKNTTWKHEFERHQSQVEKLEDRLMELKVNMKCTEGQSNELELLRRRVKTTAAMLSYLKSKARVMAVPHLASISCGIKHQEGIGIVDKHGIPLSGWSKYVKFSSTGIPDSESKTASKLELGSLETNNGKYIDEILKSTHIITDVMELLVKRAVKAETEAATEKEMVKLGLDENKRKTLQIQSMNMKVEEMERFARSTNTLLNEMKQKVEDMVEESSIQRQRAAENDLELQRVKQDFDSLRSFVSSIIRARESLLSSEQQFQTIEKLLDRLIAETAQLENAKAEKETEVQKLMEENVKLKALLDKKETQLLAMNEQYKWMVLDNRGI
ncbi:hypothetical protein Cni_G03862 [Canna indica]|uniref:Uncharacterized protein n=1 Tax=Canna indica TaxID=4628 RepID=A0AAQ3Q3G2_9LILI|nr:hypothetical protein Cni_G03862 [Canna indica]